MPVYSQDNRILYIKTPLGKDVLKASGFQGTEGISQLYQFSIDCLAERNDPVDFSKIIGQGLTVGLRLPDKKTFRYFHGICNRISQGETDLIFDSFQVEIVPQFWLLTKRTQSRIFQHVTVPQILKKVLTGLDVTFELGRYEPRDYCVQYRESDFDFASRLMEEEGIYYYFVHKDGAHTMVVADTQASFREMPYKHEITFNSLQQGTPQLEDFIYSLNKTQTLTSGKVMLWDHHFEQPHKTLASEVEIVDSVSIGAVSHKLKIAENNKLEQYDFPGGYAQRFDGVDKGGAVQAANLQKIFEDNKRTVQLRMQQEAVQALTVVGASNCRQLVSGHAHSIKYPTGEPTARSLKAEGKYVITSIQHSVTGSGNYGSGSTDGFSYTNRFESIPHGLAYRPQRTTKRPTVAGTQTAVVVGTNGEEIFTDQYGRVKVQFHWDREGKYDEGSSCWVRVAQFSAGRQWGMLSIPRIGQEVVVDFIEGDPDQPIIVGMVYNPAQMPMYKLPDFKTKSYIRSNTSMKGVGYNEIRFQDLKDAEQVYFHAQKNMDERVRNDSMERVGNNRHLRVGFYLENDHKGDASGETKKGSQFEEVAVNKHSKVHKNLDEHIGGDMKLLVGGGDGDGRVDIHIKDAKHELIDTTSSLHVKKSVHETFDDTYDWHVKKAVKQKLDATFDEHIKGAVVQTFDATHDHHVKGNKTELIGGAHDVEIKSDNKIKVGGTVSHQSGAKFQQKVGTNYALEAGQEVHIKAGMKVIIEAGAQLSLKGPGGFIDIGPTGVSIQGTMVLINSGGSAGSGSGSSPADPAAAKDAADAADAIDPVDAKPTKPTDADMSSTGYLSNISPR